MNNLSYSQQIDPISNNLNLLTKNITMLSNIHINEYEYLQKEINRLNIENDDLVTKINDQDNLIAYYIDFTNQLNSQFNIDFQPSCQSTVQTTVQSTIQPTVQNNIEEENPHIKNENINKYKFIFNKITNLSFTKNKTLEIIKNIKSIDDIVKLNGLWENIKHNPILQKLYHLIEPLKKLQQMIGLIDIKKEVFKKIIYYVMNPFKDEYLHTIISGPPGVGKTEFAKIYAEIFVNLGILKSDNFIQIKRSDLIGEFLGQTTHRTKDILDKAMGGVLFLDEAYSLGNSNKNDSYSKESIDIINQYLSEKKGEFMFIIAGYEDDLNDCLFSYNQGLRRRFQSHYNITGYNANELMQMFISMVNKSSFKLSDILQSRILDKFFDDNVSKFKYYAGDIELLFNEIKYCQSLRAFNNNIKDKYIILEDIEISLENIQLNKKDTSPPYGMYL
jgi:hypothetical protein